MNAPVGIVTIVFTDIENSTQLWDRHGAAFEACLARHNEIMRSCIAVHHGFEVKTEGDAFMVAFARATDALKFTLDTQLKLDAEPWPADIAKVMVRMGVHTGEPIVGKDPAGRTDYFGPVVNRAARVASAGHGGQILLSLSARTAAQDAVADGVLTDLGEHALKGLERPEHLFQFLPRELAGRTFAPLQTVTALQSNLPAQSSSFIGRRREVDELIDMLAPRQQEASAGTKLLRPQDKKPVTRPGVISLVGPGGTGKTRLALHVGSEVLDRYEGGVWFVDLSACRQAGEAANEVSSVLGVRLAGNENPVDAVSNVLQYRRPLLLILDNFEQLAAHSDELVGQWRRKAPQITFMVTTRAVLGLKGEREFELQPLAAPKAGEASVPKLLNFESVALFVQRAQEADPRFELDDKNAEDVGRICADLEGIPLAVELAASRVKLMKPAQILKRLENKFELLKSTRRDTGLRQRTLYDALEWSFELLTEWERGAFMQACAFHGGFLLEAAEEVIDLSAFPDAPGVLDALQSLREKSLLRTEEGEFETRFAMYKPIHDFGENRLGKAGDVPPLYRRHYQHFVKYAEAWNERVYSPDELEALNRLEHDRANIVVAQERALKQGDSQSAARMAAAMAEYFMVRGPADLRQKFIDDALAAIGDAPGELKVKLLVARSRSDYEVSALQSSTDFARRAVEGAKGQSAALRCWAHRQLAHALFMQARRDESRKHADAGFDCAREAGETLLLSQVNGTLGIILYGYQEYAKSLACFEEAERLMREVGYPTGIANHSSNRALILGRLDRREESLETYKIATDIYTRLGNRTGIGRILANSGAQLQMLGRYQEARERYLQAAAIQRETGHKHGIATALGNLGQMHTSRLVDLNEAEKYLTEAIAIAREMNSDRLMLDHLGQWGHLHRARHENEKAAQCWEQAIDIQRRLGEEAGIVRDLVHLGFSYMDCGQPAKSAAAFEDAISIGTRIGTTTNLGRAQIGRALQLYTTGRVAESDELLNTGNKTMAKTGPGDSMDWILLLGDHIHVRQKAGDLAAAKRIAALVVDISDRVPPLDMSDRTRDRIKEARVLAGRP